MSPPESCGITLLAFDDGGERPRIALGAESDEWWLGTAPHTTCHDCGVITGQIHHIGCDMEQCPRCAQQLIGCDCEVVGER
jgi:hypothetical protein